jgi:dihydrofolate reductase
MKIVISEFLTLDGVMQGPGNDEPNFPRRGWNLPYMDEAGEQYKTDELLGADGLLLGEVTYLSFANSWPKIEMGTVSDKMNGLKKYVVSPTLKPEQLTWNNTEHIKGDMVEAVQKLRQTPGKDIVVYGSATLVQSLIQNDLVDEYRLMVHPVILGEGKRLFQDGLDKKTLKLVEAKAIPSGVVILTYVPETK